MEKDNLTLFPSPRQNDMIQIASIALLKAASLLLWPYVSYSITMESQALFRSVSIDSKIFTISPDI